MAHKGRQRRARRTTSYSERASAGIRLNAKNYISWCSGVVDFVSNSPSQTLRNRPPRMSTHTTAPPPMYNAEGDGADIYLRINSTSASTMPDEHDNSEPIPFVVMLIYGPTNALTVSRG